MLTVLLHIAISFIAYSRKNRTVWPEEDKMNNAVGWILLPDAMSGLLNAKVSHCRSGSWVEFPSGVVLKQLTKKVAKQILSYKIAKGGSGGFGDILLDEFEKKNYAHQNFHDLKSHIMRDKFLEDFFLEKIIEKQQSNSYILRRNRRIIMTETDFFKELQEFQNAWFLYLVGKINKNYYILLNQKWFEDNVYRTIEDSYYPPSMMTNVKKMLTIPASVEEKINAEDFCMDEYDSLFDMSVPELMEVFDDLTYHLLIITEQEL